MCYAYYYLFVFSLVSQANYVEVLEIKHPYGNLVRPVVFHSRTRRELSTTRQEGGTHHHELLVSFNIEGEKNTLDLRLNHGLLPEGHTISYQEGGRTVLHRPKKEEIDFCHYSGHIQGKPNSWVAVSTCDGLSGALFDGTKIRYVKPVNATDIQSLHYIYERNDLKMNHKCGTNDWGPEETHQLTTKGNITRGVRLKRDRSFPVQGPYKSNARSRYVELVLVADYAHYVSANRNLRILHRQLQETVNVVNALYSPLNIFIALTGVEVWTEGDRISFVKNSTTTLNRFLEYRRKHLFKNFGHHDHAHIITATKFYDGVVGLAYLSSMCSYQSSGAIIQQSTPVDAETIASTANVMAHEMGHSLGMSHDSSKCTCRDKHCIMHYSVTTPLSAHWSECSLKALAYGFSKGMDYCLRNKPASLFGSPSCGNGFVEPGEECDCGVTMGDTTCHACCHPETCKLRSEAKCATGPCCNLQTCQLKSAGTVCRAAERECDLPEYCSGNSEVCPEDVFKMDTTRCADKAYCIRGWCRSHDYQCKLLWGSTGNNGPQGCYDKNLEGGGINNCGYDFQYQKIQKCRRSDVVCGRLHCEHYNNHLEFGEVEYSIGTNYIFSKGKLKACHSARVDFGLSDVDPGMVPDGASCGDDMMCFKQQCLSVDEVWRQRKSKGCLANCSGRGVCNTKGKCHCDDGFAPPLCDTPGVGGSEVSGPAADPTVQKTFKLVMFIIFLGIVSLIVLILFLIYCIKSKPQLCYKNNDNQQTPSTISSAKNVFNIFFNNKENIKTHARPEIIKKITKNDIKVANIEVVETVPISISNNDSNRLINGHKSLERTHVKLNNEDAIVQAVPIHNRIASVLYSIPNKIKPDLKTKVKIETVHIEPRQQYMPGNKLKSNHTVITRPTAIKVNLNEVVSSHKLEVDLPPTNKVIAKPSIYENANNIRRPVLQKDVRDAIPKLRPKPKNPSMSKSDEKSSTTALMENDRKVKIETVHIEPRQQYMSGNKLKSNHTVITRPTAIKVNSNEVVSSDKLEVDLPPTNKVIAKPSVYENANNVRRPVLQKDVRDAIPKLWPKPKNPSVSKSDEKSSTTALMENDRSALPILGSVKNMKSYWENGNI